MNSRRETHGKTPFIITLSQLFQSFSFYGVRGILIIYLISETVNWSQSEVMEIYGWLTTGIVVSGIIGGLVGDLLLSSKNVAILGMIIHGIGAVLMASQTYLSPGILMIIIGTGFYKPNIRAMLGKCYFDKPGLLDAGFILLVIGLNIGSFLGIFIIGYVSQYYGFEIGFYIVAAMSILSILSLLFVNNSSNLNSPEEPKDFSHESTDMELLDDVEIVIDEPQKRFVSNTKYLLLILVVFGLFSLGFNYGFQYNDVIISNFKYETGASTYSEIARYFDYVNLLGIGIMLFFFFYWTQNYSKPISKFKLATSISILSLLLVIAIYAIASSNQNSLIIMPLIFIVLILNEFNQAIITPILFTFISLNASHKYLATWMSLANIPGTIFIYLVSHSLISKSEHFGSLFSIVFGLFILLGVFFIIRSIQKKEIQSL